VTQRTDETDRPRLLVVDDAEDVLAVVSDLLRMHNYDVTEAAGGQAAVAALGSGRFDAVLTDLEMPAVGGMEVLVETRRRDPEIPVVLVTAYSTIERAVEAMREGAFDFIEKPVRSEDLLAVVERAVRRRAARAPEGSGGEGVAAGHGPAGADGVLIGTAPAMRRVLDDVARVAAGDTTVLLLGESGTGKEMVSRLLHARSPRRDGPLVVINCAAIPDELLENELFGSEKGAFTGAAQRKPGKFELAEKGTIVLDEIGDLNHSLQAKLLRVLEEREFERLGGTRTIPLDVRVVAATNRDLEDDVEAGRFREDLFYRLNVFPIHLPALRERPEDVAPLVAHFVAETSRDLNKPVPEITREAMARFEAHDWPGNVRELRNVVERAVILCDGERLEAGHVVIRTRRKPRGAPAEAAPDDRQTSGVGDGGRGACTDLSLKDASRRAAAEAEIALIRRVMDDVRWNRRAAARRLGVSYKTLWNKLKEYRLD